MILQNLFKRKLPKGQIVWCIGLPYTKDAFLCCFNKKEPSDFVDSLQLQYGSMDAEILWTYYEQTATKISEAINYLVARNVDVINLHSVEQLKTVYSYPTIIITVHRHRYLDCLDFMGNIININEVVDSIPKDFEGVVDISSCFSATFQMLCKQKAMKATFIAAETESSVDLRLFIYLQTIKHLISHKNGNYLDSFRVIIRRIVESNEGRNNKKGSVLLGGKTSPSKTLVGSASAFAPNEIKRGENVMIQIYVYKGEERQYVICEAEKTDEDATERSYIPLNFDIKVGDSLTVSLNVINCPKLTQSKSFIWQDRVSKACFVIPVSSKYKKEKLFFETFITINHALLGELDFSISVVDVYSPEKKVAKILSKKFSKVFISYSHLDEQQVKFIAQAYKAIGANYFFDRHYLDVGSIYPLEIQEFIDSADLFILCWSKNAAESEYVDKELSQALSLAFPQVQPKENARLTIYPLSISSDVELPSNMKDIYNFEIL